MKYQHATDNRDEAIADRLASLSRSVAEPVEKKMRHAEGTDTGQTPESGDHELRAETPLDESPTSEPDTHRDAGTYLP
jgi:hypothetical protein